MCESSLLIVSLKHAKFTLSLIWVSCDYDLLIWHSSTFQYCILFCIGRLPYFFIYRRSLKPLLHSRSITPNELLALLCLHFNILVGYKFTTVIQSIIIPNTWVFLSIIDIQAVVLNRSGHLFPLLETSQTN